MLLKTRYNNKFTLIIICIYIVSCLIQLVYSEKINFWSKLKTKIGKNGLNNNVKLVKTDNAFSGNKDDKELMKEVEALLKESSHLNSDLSIVADNESNRSFHSNQHSSQHTNNWAVLVCTSRFWFNYRHIANTLSMYRTVKRLGIPDSNIILMLADDVACNARNHFPATVYNHASRNLDLYGSNIEVDYRGYDVTAENFVRLLTGRHDRNTPRSKRLLTNDRSNIFVYLTGHGGNEFIKFQDSEEISSHDIADSFSQMFEKGRYNELFLMVDSCQAASMYRRIESPRILATSSSLKGQDSYSHHADPDIGVAVIDRFTYYNLEVLENIQMSSQSTLGDLFSSYQGTLIASTPGIFTDYFDRDVGSTLITDFFGGVHNVILTNSGYELDD